MSLLVTMPTLSVSERNDAVSSVFAATIGIPKSSLSQSRRYYMKHSMPNSTWCFMHNLLAAVNTRAGKRLPRLDFEHNMATLEEMAERATLPAVQNQSVSLEMTGQRLSSKGEPQSHWASCTTT